MGIKRWRTSSTKKVREVARRGFSHAPAILETVFNRNRIDREELRKILKENDSFIEYGSVKSVSIKTPDAYFQLPDKIEKRTGTYSISKPFVGVIKNAQLVGSYPLAVSESKYIAEASGSPNIQFLNILNSVARLPNQIFSKAIKREPIEEAVLLHHYWVDGYYHWTTETLTRLEGVEKYMQETGRKPKLIVGPSLNSFQKESLALLGFEEEDLINWQQVYGTVNRLVIPSMRREINPGKPSPIDHSWLRSKLRNKALEEVDTSQFSKRVYISRDDADRRRVKNEADVMELLSSYGFEKYTLEDMHVIETIALFAQADCIVAPHGAGLTDLIHSKDIAVVELHRADRLDDSYFMLTNHIDSWYGYLICEGEGFDMVVDLDRLNQMVSLALNQRAVGNIKNI